MILSYTDNAACLIYLVAMGKSFAMFQSFVAEWDIYLMRNHGVVTCDF